MKADVILTTGEIGKLYDKKVGTVTLTRGINMLDLFGKLARKHFAPTMTFNVRRDNNVFGWVAVDRDGDTLTLR